MWYLVPRPTQRSIIVARWVFRNKLVVQGNNQEEGIYYDKTFSLIARMEAIRFLIAFAIFMGFKIFYMDVKSVFLKTDLKGEVNGKQPLRFKDANMPNHVFKLNKSFYGLKQAPRDWYKKWSKFLLKEWFQEGKNRQHIIFYEKISKIAHHLSVCG